MGMSPSMWKQTLSHEGVSRGMVTQILNEAADHLADVGLHKGSLFPYTDSQVREPRSTQPCCGWGAIEVVKDGKGERTHVAAYLAEEALSLAVGARLSPATPHVGHFPNWNDAHATTQEQVLALMRETATAIVDKTGVFA